MKRAPKKKPEPRLRPASTDNAWTASKHAELSAREGVTFCYLLTDQDGIALIAQGTLPEYVREQARRACEWCLIDLPVEKAI